MELPLNAQIASLQLGVRRLEDVMDTNTRAFNDAMMLLETQGGITRRIFNDLIGHKLYLTNGQIDYAAYEIEFWVYMSIASFVHSLFLTCAAKEAPVVTDYMDSIVFGGL